MLKLNTTKNKTERIQNENETDAKQIQNEYKFVSSTIVDDEDDHP